MTSVYLLNVGSEQQLKIEFANSPTPTLLNGNVVVLNEGHWDVRIEGDPGECVWKVIRAASLIFSSRS